MKYVVVSRLWLLIRRALARTHNIFCEEIKNILTFFPMKKKKAPYQLWDKEVYFKEKSLDVYVLNRLTKSNKMPKYFQK